MIRLPAWRGQPVLVLVALLAGWFALRAVLWETPFVRPPRFAHTADANETAAPVADLPPLRFPVGEPPSPGAPGLATPTAPVDPLARAGRRAGPPAAGSLLAFPLPSEPAAQRAIERPSFAEPVLDPPRLPGASAPPSASRWSGDAWLLLREDTTTPITSGRGSYGRSQLGGVLRYRLAPASGHRPTAYLRAAAALSGAREGDLALGLSGRPLSGVPVVLAGEMRLARNGDILEARPAAFAYSEFPPVALPLGARGEAYLQAGYVGGRYATGFVDGQLRVERDIVRLGPAELRAGAGAWGGAQKGAKRLDLGPGVTLAVDLGGAPLRVSADWRFRIAGDANPGSGPALTVSTGF